MRLTPANLISGSYSDDALSWAAMRTVNWLPEVAEVEGTRTVKKLATPPGLSLLVDLGTRAPVRGIADVEGRLFAVSGDSLFEVSNDLAVTNRGSIPGVGRVSMAHNKQGGASAANELAIANGLSGYVYNTDSTALSQITDSAFEGASTFDYVDGYMSYTDPQGRWWGHSDLNQATQYSSIDRNDAESAPDPIISHIVSHREVIVWGTRTGEFFRNTGAATGTFQRVDGTEMEVGICSTFARARVDNTVCWVGNDLAVYRLNGHAPQRISTRPIEQALSRVDPANVFCFAWEDRGHKVFYITSPGDFTLGFDFSSGIWHERQSYGLDRWRVNCLARWGNRWIAGDYANGLLYKLDWDVFTENGRPMVSEVASGYTTADQNKVLAPYAELIFDTGGPQSPGLSISGDVPDGNIGETVDPYTYSVSGGVWPYGERTIISGALPTGLSMNAAGVVTGTRSTGGVFSWEVQVIDADGTIATVADTSETITDPSYADVLSLVHMEGSGSTFVDQKGLTWFVGSSTPPPVQTDAQAKFGEKSVFFNPNVVDSTPSFMRANLTGPLFGGDFTVEGFVMFTSIAGEQSVWCISGANPFDIDIQMVSGQWRVYRPSSATTLIPLAGVATTGVFYHFALVRVGTVITLYIDGTSIGSGTFSNIDFAVGYSIQYGASGGANSAKFTGYIDEVRVTKMARYTANFTPPSRAFPDG